MMKTLYSLCVALIISVAAFGQATITIKIDMTSAIDSGYFVVGTDVPDIAGSFNGWSGTVMTLEEGNIYTLEVADLTADETIEFKCRAKQAWNDNDEFAGGGANRTFVVADGAVYKGTYDVVELGFAAISEAVINVSAASVYPNPASVEANFNYTVANASNVNVTLYDVLGNAVNTVVNENHTAGNYQQNIDVSSLQSGLYFYVVSANGSSQSAGKFTVVK